MSNDTTVEIGDAVSVTHPTFGLFRAEVTGLGDGIVAVSVPGEQYTVAPENVTRVVESNP